MHLEKGLLHIREDLLLKYQAKAKSFYINGHKQKTLHYYDQQRHESNLKGQKSSKLFDLVRIKNQELTQASRSINVTKDYYTRKLDEINRTQPKIVRYPSPPVTKSKRYLCTNSSPMLRDVSSFTAKKPTQDTKLSRMVTLLARNQLKKMAFAVQKLKQNAPHAALIGQLAKRKAQFRLKEFSLRIEKCC